MDSERTLLISQAAELACAMEVLSPKPGNVSPGKPFKYLNDMTFVASSIGLSEAFRDPGESVGKLVERAVRATARLVGKNSNLGIILLLAPLARAANDILTGPDSLRQGGGISAGNLRGAVKNVLAGLDGDDSSSIYRAIRSASPEGLGKSERYDVTERGADGGEGIFPPVMEAMRFASAWDSVAGEYATGYEITFGLTVPKLTSLWREGRTLRSSVVQTFLFVMSEVPDTLIARKLGAEVSNEVSRAARRSLGLGGCFSEDGRRAARDLTAMLDDRDNLMNPGTTADLVAAGIFVFLEDELGRTPLPELLDGWDRKNETEER
ncbi:MAG: triphosphoribosyl-dephospho-CoA synthase [Synergistaceae bacterium]|jgi:triphosphoribosyl-dephospho-CoA synthase|nr:triphosphoribosyl-dephospho-CoA synthase [Synergistaceae bacterium]